MPGGIPLQQRFHYRLSDIFALRSLRRFPTPGLDFSGTRVVATDIDLDNGNSDCAVAAIAAVRSIDFVGTLKRLPSIRRNAACA